MIKTPYKKLSSPIVGALYRPCKLPFKVVLTTAYVVFFSFVQGLIVLWGLGSKRSLLGAKFHCSLGPEPKEKQLAVHTQTVGAATVTKLMVPFPEQP